MSNTKQATRMAQAILVGSGANIVIDGIWGPKSQAAFNQNSESIRDLTVTGAKTVAPEIPWSVVSHIPRPSNVGKRTFKPVGPTPQQSALVYQAAAEYGVPAEDLFALISIESAFRPNVVSSTGTYKGLGQMGPDAWSEARAYAQRNGKWDFGPYGNWSDEKANIFATTANIKVNEGFLRKKGYTGPLNGAIRYLVHQQGAGGFNSLYNAAKARRPATETQKAAMKGNPPQDGLGVTLDPHEFITRWNAVATRRASNWA